MAASPRRPSAPARRDLIATSSKRKGDCMKLATIVLLGILVLGSFACMQANDPRTRIPSSTIVASFIQSPFRFELVAIRSRLAGAEGLRGEAAITCRSQNEASTHLSTRLHA